jgi:hypothetical protein
VLAVQFAQINFDLVPVPYLWKCISLLTYCDADRGYSHILTKHGYPSNAPISAVLPCISAGTTAVMAVCSRQTGGQGVSVSRSGGGGGDLLRRSSEYEIGNVHYQLIVCTNLN